MKELTQYRDENFAVFQLAIISPQLRVVVVHISMLEKLQDRLFGNPLAQPLEEKHIIKVGYFSQHLLDVLIQKKKEELLKEI